MFNSISILDLFIIAAYLITVLSLGLYYSSKNEKTYQDYFLSGKNLGWFTVGISIFATNISSEHFIGLAGSASSRGLVVGQFELMAIFILVFLGWFLSPIYIKSGITTVPEFLEQRFDARTRKVFASISIILYLFTKISITLFAGGILFNKIFGINIYTSTIILVLITGIYSVIGGAQAISKTHVIQGILILLGASLVTFFGLFEVGGFGGLTEKLPDHYFKMFKPMSDPEYPWTGIIFGAPIIAFWYWCTDTYIVQRLLGAQSIEQARKGSLFAAFLKLTPIFILVLPGLIAVALFPEITGDDAYPMLLASDIIPIGIKGIVITSFLAAIMSSLASVFNSTAAIFINDFYKPKHPDINERKLVLVSRLITTLTVIAAILSVPLVKLISSQMYFYLQGVQGIISPPITAVFLMGIFYKKATSRGAFYTLIIGEIIGISRLASEMMVNAGMIDNVLIIAFTKINFMHFAVALFLFSIALFYTLTVLAPEKGKSSFLRTLLDETRLEYANNIKELNRKTVYKSNILVSALIFLLIIGLWSLLS